MESDKFQIFFQNILFFYFQHEILYKFKLHMNNELGFLIQQKFLCLLPRPTYSIKAKTFDVGTDKPPFFDLKLTCKAHGMVEVLTQFSFCFLPQVLDTGPNLHMTMWKVH